MSLSSGQSIDDFYCQLVEKANTLKKPDHEILVKFIKGLPEQLAFFVRAGHHRDSPSALAAAKMGEAYGYRKAELQVAAASKQAKPSDKRDSEFASLQSQIDTLTKAVQNLTASKTDESTKQNRRTDRFAYSRQQATYPPQATNSRQQATYLPQATNNLCFNCNSPNHIKRYCNWNGQGVSSSDITCQLCDQIGHSAVNSTCIGNRENPEVNNVQFSTEKCEDGELSGTKFFSYFDIPKHLSESEQGQLKGFLKSHDNIFVTDENPALGFTDVVQHKIILKPDFKPKYQRSYRLTPDKKTSTSGSSRSFAKTRNNFPGW
ncbi:Hypothetical predicted protein [Mytilus galloprovincialis]|uniref:CCHC-type domain-containing protein n=1 Tax=Mytilus galloprovincialis TaxID=29158 RepID=A0A8B6E7K9_MYTGA|nr:Hypothetical predicted protein [Mytilus galloprovincialis]